MAGGEIGPQVSEDMREPGAAVVGGLRLWDAWSASDEQELQLSGVESIGSDSGIPLTILLFAMVRSVEGCAWAMMRCHFIISYSAELEGIEFGCGAG